jgi:hypothetical protein
VRVQPISHRLILPRALKGRRPLRLPHRAVGGPDLNPPLRVEVPRPPVRGLALTEPPLDEARLLLADGLVLMELTALCRVARLPAGGVHRGGWWPLARVALPWAEGHRPVGLSRLGGVARLPVAGSRRAGLSPLVGAPRLPGVDLRPVRAAGVARPTVAGSRRLGLSAAGGVQLAAVGFRLAGVGFRLAGVAGGRALVELARPGAWDPRPARAFRSPAPSIRLGRAVPSRGALVRLWPRLGHAALCHTASGREAPGREALLGA